MELPYEIVDIIREFSKPVNKHYIEYNRYVLIHGEWSELKEAITGKQTDKIILDKIIMALVTYMNAVDAQRDAYRALDEIKLNPSVQKLAEQDHRDVININKENRITASLELRSALDRRLRKMKAMKLAQKSDEEYELEFQKDDEVFDA